MLTKFVQALSVSLVCVPTVFGGDAGRTEDQKLTASDADFDDRFGVSVAVSGTTAVVGCTTTITAGSTGPALHMCSI